jgi:hypothetical protein
VNCSDQIDDEFGTNDDGRISNSGDPLLDRESPRDEDLNLDNSAGAADSVIGSALAAMYVLAVVVFFC